MLADIWGNLMLADFWGNMRGVGSDHADTRIGGRYFTFYLIWLTFLPMLLLLLGRPIGLVLAYGVLGWASSTDTTSRGLHPCNS